MPSATTQEQKGIFINSTTTDVRSKMGRLKTPDVGKKYFGADLNLPVKKFLRDFYCGLYTPEHAIYVTRSSHETEGSSLNRISPNSTRPVQKT
jgi:hypothetical protein